MPAEVYTRSGRLYRGLEDLAYPFHNQTMTTVTHRGRLCFEREKVNLSTFIATLVERQSRYVPLVRLPSKDTHTVTRAVARRIRRLPRGLMKSLPRLTPPNLRVCPRHAHWNW